MEKTIFVTFGTVDLLRFMSKSITGGSSQ